MVSVLWTRPVERKSAHRINLFIVFYADFLLILQYFYCMILSADELPLQDSAIFANLAQIGIVRYDAFQCVPLIFKAVCLLTFCFTLHQEQLELQESRSTNRCSSSFQFNPTTDHGKTIRRCFIFGINVLTHLWVAMILIAIFIYSIYGEEVTLLKLCYMVFIMAFIMSYQISLRLWRKITYALWMLIIVSSMGNLIVIYTYQFDGFDFLWENQLGIDKHMCVFEFFWSFKKTETKKLVWFQAKYYWAAALQNKRIAYRTILPHIHCCYNVHSVTHFSQQIHKAILVEISGNLSRFENERKFRRTERKCWQVILWKSRFCFFFFLFASIFLN